jgi:GTP-binding protein
MIDSALIKVKAGDGGDGIASFRREAFVPRGGPDGGDGGRGGDIVFEASTSVNTLLRFQRERVVRAGDGAAGGKKKMSGKSADDIVINVPVGTEVWDITDGEPGELIGDLTFPGARMVVAKGGAGGTGNVRFASSTNQVPMLAEAGEPGEELDLRLNLKVLADVGLVGMPNAGKSSILASISAARPKIANYPFTTLEPVLGVVHVGIDAFVVVDIPGLIEGAHEGVGLGDEFLKHIERTRVLAHVVDGSEPGISDRIKTINNELRQFNEEMSKRPQFIVVNKTDLFEDEGRKREIEKELKGDFGSDVKVLFISAATRDGMDALIQEMWRMVKAMPRKPESYDVEPQTILRPEATRRERSAEKVDDGVFRLVHRRALRLARGSDLNDWQTLVQFQKKLGDMGVTRELEAAGIMPGDTLIVGEEEFEWD